MRKLLVSILFTLLIISTMGFILSSCRLVGSGTTLRPTLDSTNASPWVSSPKSFTPTSAEIIPSSYSETTTTVELSTLSILPTETSSKKPTESPSKQPTETPFSFFYFFPLQPPSLASFSEGVISHGYPATDIFAPEGTKFVAVTSGVVDFVSNKDTWDALKDDPATRGGLSVAIIGDDGVRYYGSHLSSVQGGIKPGIRVEAGQLLGFVGHTGDARNTQSHLHFGISRPSYPEDWKARRGQVDPYAYLFAWRSGVNITPGLPSP